MTVPLPPGNGAPSATAREPRVWEGESVPVLAAGYEETEHLLSGSAQTYAGPVAGPVSVTSADNRYVTRILVRYPCSAEDFSGRVLVEPFNNSFGEDRDALWARVGGLLQAQGDAWIGITDRAMSAAALRNLNPVRYGEIDFPVNDLAWDALRDLGTLLKAGGPGSPLGQLAVHRVYLGGYSASAVDVATFVATFHAGARVAGGAPIYDGYFPAAHAASYAAVASGDVWQPPREHVRMPGVDVPVIEVQPQSDVEGFSAKVGSADFVNPGSAWVRQTDSNFRHGRYRLYELAGAPHVARLDGCDGSGSSFPTSAFMRAALLNLFRWVEEGTTPPRAARIGMQDVGPVSVARVDRYGNPLGGVRSAHLDVPLARYEAHSTPGPLCQLVGRETPLPAETLVARFRNAGQYLSEFTAALDVTVRTGYLLAADREQIVKEMTVKAREAFAVSDDQEVLIP
jgi:hypothetical protein